MKTYFYQNNKKAFTLVELLVVVIILATLATIGVISYRNHMSGVRDTNRLSQLANMRNAIEAYATIGDIPFPEESVEIQASGKVIAYQGYMGQTMLTKIGYNDGGKDPKDDTFFTYLVSANAKYFQLLGFLEESPKGPISFLDGESIFPQAYAINYESRYPRVTGDSLGILTQSGTNTPIQEIESLVGSGYLDIENTNDAYNAHLGENEKISGTGANLSIVKAIIQQGSLDAVPTSCLKLLSSSSSLKNQDGNYEVYSLETGEKIEVYCDMTTDGGGYTFYAIDSGIETFKSTDNNSCKDLGMDIIIPRTKEHLQAMIDKYGSSYFSVIPGVTKASNGGNFTSVAMNSVSAPQREALDGGRWWLRGTPYTEPNGDYTKDCWLGTRTFTDANNITFNDLTAGYSTTQYICSTNDKE